MFSVSLALLVTKVLPAPTEVFDFFRQSFGDACRTVHTFADLGSADLRKRVGYKMKSYGIGVRERND